jgi:hypothetical protein
MKMRKMLCFAALLVSVLNVLAADSYKPLNVKTGLWQVTLIHSATGLPPIPPDMQARMAQMTPEQRARIEEMMRSKFGGTPQTSTYTTCVTAKDLNTNPWANRSEEKCKWTVVNSTDSDMEVKGSACAAGRTEGMKTDIDIKFHAVDPENVKASMQGTASDNGRTTNFSGTYTGKWIGATCPAAGGQ